MHPNYLVKARWFVLTHGEDCDGYFTPQYSSFVMKDRALHCLASSQDWSDGQSFSLATEQECKDYCDYYGIAFDPSFLCDEIYSSIKESKYANFID